MACHARQVQRRVKPQRRIVIALWAYVVVLVFALGAAAARQWGADMTAAAVAGAVIAAPLAIALIGDRVTSLRAFSVEVSLAEVSVPTAAVDLTSALMVVAEMGASGAMALLAQLRVAIAGQSRVLRIDLRDEKYWWSTRVFLLAALADDYSQIDGFVFVRSGSERLFVGIAAPRRVRKRLATLFPAYEAAYRAARAAAMQAGQPSADRELDEVLMWRWSGAMPTEAATRVVVAGADLKAWLESDLDDESLPYGPLTPLLRYRILARPQRYAALTEQRQLVAIVDAEQLARRASLAELERQLT
jgi:hypothetical protein